MDNKDCFYIFHWLPDEDRWEPITWEHWQAFQGKWLEPIFGQLPGTRWGAAVRWTTRCQRRGRMRLRL
jgi:hypothetical protein